MCLPTITPGVGPHERSVCVSVVSGQRGPGDQGIGNNRHLAVALRNSVYENIYSEMDRASMQVSCVLACVDLCVDLFVDLFVDVCVFLCLCVFLRSSWFHGFVC